MYVRSKSLAGAGMLLAWFGCVSAQGSVDDSLGAAVFGYSFVNPAMGLLHQGFFVTSAGNVFGYRYTGADRPLPAELPSGDLVSEAALREQMSRHRQLLARVSPEVMEKQMNRVSQQFTDADAGAAPSGDRRVAYDQGTSAFSVYRYDAARHGYARVPATGLLLAWLQCLSKSLRKGNEVSSCQ